MTAAVEASSRAGLEPSRVVPGARFSLCRSGLSVNDIGGRVTVGGLPARVVFASADRVAIETPGALDGGAHDVAIAGISGHAVLDVATELATGLHQVDSPVVDADGYVYGTYSGPRGQEAAVSVFRIGKDGVREPFVSGLVNATSLALSSGGTLYVSSRFDGTVSRVFDDGRYEVVASDLGRACGLAFAPDGTLFVGDRSGTIFHLDMNGTARTFAKLPPSVAAFHLALGPDEALYVTGPTLAPRDDVYRIEASGRVTTLGMTFGRPQGLAFSPDGVLHVVEALAGSNGVYRCAPEARPELVVGGRGLVGITFGPDGQMVLCSSDTIYTF